jgi:glycosyltransferase involved in cell wall biosynthesis
MNLNITLPCYNEEKILKKNVLFLFDFLKRNITTDQWQIIIADNRSSDKTAEIAKKLAKIYPQIQYLAVLQKGKGVAIRAGWQRFPADLYIFMDADLATDLSALPNLIKAIQEKNYDLVIGSRFHSYSQVKRGILRKFISYCYNIVRKALLRSTVSDAPCGFKAVNQKIIKEILPQVQNNQWFFDSELVILAEKQGYKIKEIPIKWEDIREEQDKSRVKVISLGLDYFKNLVKLRKRLKK